MPELRLALLALGIVLVIGVYLYTRWQGDRDRPGPSPGRSKRRVDTGDLPSVSVPASKKRQPGAEEGLPKVAVPGRDRQDSMETEPDVEPDAPVPEPDRPYADSEPAESIGEADPEPVGEIPDAGEDTDDGLPRDADAEDADPDGAELSDFDPDSQKIVSLHVSAAGDGTLDGAGLRRLLEAAGMRHGQYDIFHRTVSDDDGRPSLLFSVASMVEPGHFDLSRMDESEYRGVTFFAVLPGALPGIKTFHEMLAVAHRIAEELDGEVRDEARNPFSVQRATHIEEEITEFERRRRSMGRERGKH